MDLARLSDDLRAAAPDYCLNVPALLERMRAAVEGQLSARGGIVYKIFQRAKAASLQQGNGSGVSGTMALALARVLDFPGDSQKAGTANQGADLRVGSAGHSRRNYFL